MDSPCRCRIVLAFAGILIRLTVCSTCQVKLTKMNRREFVGSTAILAGLAFTAGALLGPGSGARARDRTSLLELPSDAVRVGYGPVFDFDNYGHQDRFWNRMQEGDLLGIARNSRLADESRAIDVYWRAWRIGNFGFFGPRHGIIARKIEDGVRFTGRIQCLHPSRILCAEVFAVDGPVHSLPPLRLSGLPDHP